MPAKPSFRRVVVKLGSGVLSAGTGKLDHGVVRRVARELGEARSRGVEAVVVSSGAILAGAETLELRTRPATTQLKQAAAAVGQTRLMQAWEAGLAREGLKTAQILLTREDLRQRQRYLNARNTLFTLLRLGVVPVINENDTVSVDEIKFGDNDTLSALVADLCEADLLLLLTDQEGVFTADPRSNKDAALIPQYDAEAKAAIGKAGPSGSGGMGSKVTAACAAAAAGLHAVVASGAKGGILASILDGDRPGTWFEPKGQRQAQRRRWLAHATQPKGQIIVDAGARQALVGALKSLLPSGVRGVARQFEAGDVVSLVEGGREFARGLTNYGSAELEKIMGKKTAEIAGLLGHKPADEVVHRDNLAVLE
jgi:glutamate 5-kinase